MSTFAAVPRCSIEIYPFELGPYTLQDQQLLRVVTRKNIRSNTGTFEILLAPGGPNGINIGPAWAEVITPMSFVLIGMQRWQYSAIPMVGVVRRCYQTDIWDSDQGKVIRTTVVEGEDFSYFFNTVNYYNLSFLGMTAGTAVGQALGYPDFGLPATISAGLLAGTPASVGKAWFTDVMAASGGILGKTFIPYQGVVVPFSGSMGTFFEEFPDNQIIPFGEYFIADQGSWTQKFQAIFQWPFYEFFIGTASPGLYGNAAPPTTFNMKTLTSAEAVSPVLVARLNPLPFIPVSSDAAFQNFTTGAIDTTAWSALPLYQLDNFGFNKSQIAFSDEEVRNFYLINPTWFRNMTGQSNDSVNFFVYAYAAGSDAASIHRFGYRPEITATRWLSDLTGSYAQGGSGAFIAQGIPNLLGRVSSYYEPTYLMARGEVEFVLRPDILPGTRFQYSPLKNAEPWMFYIEGVTHEFIFGGPSVTRLDLARGLPASVYADAGSDGRLQAIHLGNANRVDGEYVKYSLTVDGQAVPGLTFFSCATPAMQQILGNMAQIFATPQASGSP